MLVCVFKRVRECVRKLPERVCVYALMYNSCLCIYCHALFHPHLPTHSLENVTAEDYRYHYNCYANIPTSTSVCPMFLMQH